MSKRVVVIGGGNGSAISINALKTFKENVQISAVIGMSDTGGANGKLRKIFGLPYSDLMRATIAMTKYDSDILKQIFYRNRFSDCGKLDTHYLGNIFMALAVQYDGDVMHAVRALHQAVEAVGEVHPVTLEPSDLCAELSSGEIIVGEHEIDRPVFDRTLRIKRAWLKPSPMLHEPARRAIAEADVIILGPGSLYTSIATVLAVDGVKDAIEKSKAQIIFVAGNAYEKRGETGPQTLSGFVKELEVFLPRPVDVTVYNNHVLTPESKKKYIEKEWELFAYDSENLVGKNIVQGDYEKPGGGLSPEKLGNILREIIKD